MQKSMECSELLQYGQYAFTFHWGVFVERADSLGVVKSGSVPCRVVVVLHNLKYLY